MSKEVTFIDLFAGIGGFHFAFNGLAARCVFASEKDKAARMSYEHNFMKVHPGLFKIDPDGTKPYFNEDIKSLTRPDKLDPSGKIRIPDFDVMCGGFPCQPFSHAGLRKGMSEERGTLFDDMIFILESKIREQKPASAFFLENVRGLKTHMSESTKTIDIIENKIRDLGYTYHLIEVRASDFGVPQHRPRLFIFGFLTSLPNNPKWAREILKSNQIADNKFADSIRNYQENPGPRLPIIPSLEEILGGSIAGGRKVGYTLRVGGRGSGLEDRRNWDTYEVAGAPLRIDWKHGLALQGFPNNFEFPDAVSSSQRMKQLGNSVAVPAVRFFAEKLVDAIVESRESR